MCHARAGNVVIHIHALAHDSLVSVTDCYMYA